MGSSIGFDHCTALHRTPSLASSSSDFENTAIYSKMMKVTLAALLALQAATGVAAFAPVAPPRPAFGLRGVSGAATSAEEDLMLTLKVIMDHAERSTTASKDQFLSQMEESAAADEAEPIDVSIPYDAAAKLAYEAAGSPGEYEAFKTQFEADAVADVIAKNAPPAEEEPEEEPAEEESVDLSIPYDAAAKLAYEKAGSPGDYEAFKTQFEEDAVADVIAKNAPPAEEEPEEEPEQEESVDLSIPYDAAAKLAYEKAGSPGDYAEFKTKFEEDAVADVIAKNAKTEEAVAA